MIWMWSANSEKEKVRDKKKKIDELRMQDGRKVIRLEKRDKDANRIHVWLFRIEIKKKDVLLRGELSVRKEYCVKLSVL